MQIVAHVHPSRVLASQLVLRRWGGLLSIAAGRRAAATGLGIALHAVCRWRRRLVRLLCKVALPRPHQLLVVVRLSTTTAGVSRLELLSVELLSSAPACQ